MGITGALLAALICLPLLLVLGAIIRSSMIGEARRRGGRNSYKVRNVLRLKSSGASNFLNHSRHTFEAKLFAAQTSISHRLARINRSGGTSSDFCH